MAVVGAPYMVDGVYQMPNVTAGALSIFGQGHSRLFIARIS